MECIEKIKVNRLVTVDDAIRAIRELQCHAKVPELVVDFSTLEYARVISTSLFAREFRLCVRDRLVGSLPTRCTGYNENKSVALSYLADVGFFDFIGIHDCGVKVGTAPEMMGSSSCLPITKYNYRRFKTAAEYDPFRREYDYIFDEARKIAGILGGRGIRNDVLTYAICEVMRNAYEHSQSNDFYAWGQTVADGSVDIVIMDDGIGLMKSLKKKYPAIGDESEAVIKSLEPGVSGSDFLKNPYNNSGFGLYVLSELAKRYGYMAIASGNVAMDICSTGNRQFSVTHDGTLVGVHFDAIPSDIKKVMEAIVTQGDAISSVSEYPIHPSKETLNF